ncbi:hypothetical protein TRIUR3_19031 [Triticum urartu]|uniref:Uncharacterized protein n=1 Tax=Triticum urartu TaxID=4572 RepID=M7YKF7_TRIUA|nr:hypothetical protein TRIUR3_19031 [Triticum urartu]
MEGGDLGRAAFWKEAAPVLWGAAAGKRGIRGRASVLRFHPSCIGMTIKEAKKREHFFCQSCTAENGKTTENFHEATAESEEKFVLVKN